MPQEIGLFEAIHTQRALRRFKPDPVSDEVVRRLIDAAIRAPSGANSQPWRFIVIRDADLKRQIAAYYLRSWRASYEDPARPRSGISDRVRSSAADMAENIQEAPAFIMACIHHDGSPSTLSRGGSIYPAVQNLLLAARGLGLASVLTSLHKRYEPEIKDLLEIPNDVETAALLPIGYPADRLRYGPTRRSAVEDVTYQDVWGRTA